MKTSYLSRGGPVYLLRRALFGVESEGGEIRPPRDFLSLGQNKVERQGVPRPVCHHGSFAHTTCLYAIDPGVEKVFLCEGSTSAFLSDKSTSPLQNPTLSRLIIKMTCVGVGVVPPLNSTPTPLNLHPRAQNFPHRALLRGVINAPKGVGVST